MANSKKLCKGCGNYYRQDESHKSFRNWCSDDCALAIIKHKKLSSKRKLEKKNRKARKELDKTSLKWQHNLTQKAFNRMRVLQEFLWFKERGIEPSCISCGKTNMDWCCGHFKTVGAHGELRYDHVNTNLQCNRYCNLGLSGNINGNKNTRGYIQGLIDRFGESKALVIFDYIDSYHEPVKYKWQELASDRKYYNFVIRKLKACLL